MTDSDTEGKSAHELLAGACNAVGATVPDWGFMLVHFSIKEPGKILVSASRMEDEDVVKKIIEGFREEQGN